MRQKILSLLVLGASLVGLSSCEKDVKYTIDVTPRTPSLYEGSSLKITVKSDPEGLPLPEVGISFSPEGIASVDVVDDGFLLKGLKAGKTTMTLTYGEISHDVQITVKKKSSNNNAPSGGDGGGNSSGSSDDGGGSSSGDDSGSGDKEPSDDQGGETPEQSGDGGNKGGEETPSGGEENPGEGGTDPIPPTPGEEDGKELKGTPTVGSIIMKDGSLKTSTDITDADKDNAIAVVYKVEGGKAYAVGKVHERNGKEWANISTTGYSTKIDALVTTPSGDAGSLTFEGYKNGSTGLSELKKVATDYNDGTNYPAWSWCEKYGTTNCDGTAFTDGWYLPSVAELFDIWKGNSDNSSAVETALGKSGGNMFESSYYWSSSQYASSDKHALQLNFGSGDWLKYYKPTDYDYVCAVRAFNY